jgi:4-carboxymuconolactone decarboxylase
MSRVAELSRASLSPEQQRLYDEVAKTIPTGRVPGPFAIWLRTPEVLEPIIPLFRAFRREGGLDERQFELMVLLVSRHWSAQFAWATHAPRAAKLGLPEAAIEAIRTRRKPELAIESDRAVYDVVNELITAQKLSDAGYAGAKAALGEPLLIELVTAAGFYMMVGMILATADTPTPDGSRPFD